MALRLDDDRTDWKASYDDLARRVEEMSRRMATERPQTGPSHLQGMRLDTGTAQDTNTRLLSDMDTLKQEMTQLKEKNNQLHKSVTSLQRDLTTLQADHFTLREDFELLQTENAKLRSSVSTLQRDNVKLKQQTISLESDMEEVRCDVMSVQNEVANNGLRKARRESRSDGPSTEADRADAASLRPEMEALARKNSELHTDLTAQRKDIRKLQQDLTSLQGKHGDVLADMSILKSEAQTLTHNFKAQIVDLQKYVVQSNTLVAFHASLSSPVTVSTIETLVCDNIISNIGGGYNNQTGVFTAPVEGVYCFLVNASPCQRDEDKRSRLSVVLDNRKIAHVYSRGLWWSTGHTVVQMLVGQSVWLRTFDDTKYTFSEGWTNFTGMLVQPQLRPSHL